MLMKLLDNSLIVLLKILEINTELDNNPHLINTDPYGNGWIAKISIKNSLELKDLLSSLEYRDSIK